MWCHLFFFKFIYSCTLNFVLFYCLTILKHCSFVRESCTKAQRFSRSCSLHWKKIGWRLLIFCEWHRKWRTFRLPWPTSPGPGPKLLEGSISLKFLLETRLQKESLDDLLRCGFKGYDLKQQFPNSAPRKHAKVVAFVEGLCELVVWCQVRSAPQFLMEKYCLKDLLVNRLGSHTSQ